MMHWSNYGIGECIKNLEATPKGDWDEKVELRSSRKIMRHSEIHRQIKNEETSEYKLEDRVHARLE